MFYSGGLNGCRMGVKGTAEITKYDGGGLYVVIWIDGRSYDEKYFHKNDSVKMKEFIGNHDVLDNSHKPTYKQKKNRSDYKTAVQNISNINVDLSYYRSVRLRVSSEGGNIEYYDTEIDRLEKLIKKQNEWKEELESDYYYLTLND